MRIKKFSLHVFYLVWPGQEPVPEALAAVAAVGGICDLAVVAVA